MPASVILKTGPEGLRRRWVGGGDGADGGGRPFPILYITTPDQPPHGGVTGSSSSSNINSTSSSSSSNSRSSSTV